VGYEPRQMTQAEIERFLAAPRHALVCVVGPGGGPQVSPVWYVHEGGRLYVSCSANSARVRALRRDPRVAICVDGGHPDARFVSLYGRARILEGDDPQLEALRWRITRRYCASDEEARQAMQGDAPADCATLVLEPERIVALDYNDGDAGAAQA